MAGPATVDVARAQLELGRTLRDLGELRAARAAYAEATRGGDAEARLESGMLLIEDRDPRGGRDTIDALIKEAGAAAGWRLLLEGARARMLAGDHAGAVQLLEQVDKITTVERWHVDRERGRLLLRRGDIVGAGRVFQKALDTSGKDVETFLLAADVVTADPKGQVALATRIKQLLPERLANVPEALIVTGKLAIAAENFAEAENAYQAAVQALEKATPRRLAQASLGLAVIAYEKKDDPAALAQLELVMARDPSIYGAYLFATQLGGVKPATAFGFARDATTYNPEAVDAWAIYGDLAARLRKPKELAEAITRITALAPDSPALAALRALR